ncbi:hypothetical protein TW65_02989 [Stemphylium lycopersici]|nr:hypothetical protein TW65_02989 [Stemphylium lycopersici]
MTSGPRAFANLCPVGYQTLWRADFSEKSRPLPELQIQGKSISDVLSDSHALDGEGHDFRKEYAIDVASCIMPAPCSAHRTPSPQSAAAVNLIGGQGAPFSECALYDLALPRHQAYQTLNIIA